MSFLKRHLLCHLLALPLAAQYYITSTVAGKGQLPPPNESTALTARLVSPRYVTTAPNGDVFFSDAYFNQVYRLQPNGTILVAAGIGRQGFAGDGGPASAALLDTPGPLALDSAGNLLIADQSNGRLRRVAADGTISTLANLGSIAGLALDTAGNVFFTLNGAHTVRRLSPAGTLTTVAGGDNPGFSGDGGPATAATLNSPSGIAVAADGTLYIADTQNHRIRRVTPTGTISTFAGNGAATFAGDAGLATAASLAGPTFVTLDAAGVVYIADTSNGRIRAVSRQGIISSLAGGGASNENGLALNATLPGLSSLALDTASGSIVAAVPVSRLIRRISGGNILTIAGVVPSNAALDNVPATSTTLLSPFGIALDANRNLYVSDDIDHRILRINPAGNLTNFAGNGIFGNAGNNGPASSATVGAPRGLAFDNTGNLWLTSGAGATIRRITPAGVISLIAGGGPGFAGDGGPAANARFLDVIDVASDTAGNIFLADALNYRVRRIAAGTGIISTIAGFGERGSAGDGGPAIVAQLGAPRGLAFHDGQLYISDTPNHRVRRIDLATGIITTVVGNGSPGFSGDGGPATSAAVGLPLGLALDSTGNLFVVTQNRIRRVDASTGVITTFAGNGNAAFAGDGLLATNASFDVPRGIAIDTDGAVYVTDSRNFRVRKIAPARIVPEGVANGATLRAGPVAPGQIISIFGFDLGPASPLGLRLTSEGKVATELGGTQVFFDDIPAPLLYTSTGQVNAVVPYGVRAPNTQLRVVFQNRPTNTITVPVTTASPGIFAVTNQDASVNSAATPAAPGSVLILYGTGEGQTAPAGVDGSVASSVFPSPQLPVTVTIGGRQANILYAGAAPGFVAGVLQVNVQIPAGVTGSVPLQLRVGDTAMPTPRSVFVQ